MAGLGLRLGVAFTAPWYWDEGYVAELAQSLAKGGRPSLGGLWHDGFFPLSTPALLPWSAAPLAALPFWDAMTGVRVWAAFWDTACILLLFGLGRRWGGAALGWLAAGAYAVLPFAVAHGGRAFYHHPSAAFLVLGVWLGLRALEDGQRRATAWAGLCQGLALATCYWAWGLPLSWLLALLWRQPARFGLALAWMVPAPTAVLALNILPDPAGAWWSIQGLWQATRVGAPASLARLVQALGQDLSRLSFLALGMAGLLWAAWRHPARWAWPAVVLALAVVEPVRQRGAIHAMAYPYQMAAPLAALGAAQLGLMLWARGGLPGRAAALAVGLLWFRPHATQNLEAWSASPSRVAELAAFLDFRGDGGTVCGLPSFNWRLAKGRTVCEPSDIGVAEGRAAGLYYPARAPASRIARDCRLERIRYAVLSRAHFLGVFRGEGGALSFLEMEREGWPVVFDNRAFRVVENPRFGASPDPAAALLGSAENYVLAAGQAHRAGRPDAEAYAQARALALGHRP